MRKTRWSGNYASKYGNYFLDLKESIITFIGTNTTLLYSFFWVIPRRLNYLCRYFGTLPVPSSRPFKRLTEMGQSVPKRRHIIKRHMKMEQTECSETSAYKIHTWGKHPKRKNTAFRTRRKFEIKKIRPCLNGLQSL